MTDLDEQRRAHAPAEPREGTPSTPAGSRPAHPSRPVPVAGAPARWRVLWAVLGVAVGALAVVLLVRQLGDVSVAEAVRTAEPGWVLATLGLSTVPFLGAALTVGAFSPVRLPRLPTVAVQVAASFLNIFGPAGLGGLALNTRYLYRHRVSTPSAVTAVLGIQVVSVLNSALIVVVVVVASGRTAQGVRLLPDAVTLLTAAAVVVLLGAVLLVRPVRRWVAARLRRPAGQAAATLRELARHPARLAVGVVGSLLVTGGFLATLATSLQAFGGSLPLLELAVVLFAGTAVGSVFPTPGGIGTVDAAIAAGLTAVGVEPAVAVLAAVTYRVMTLWVWVLPGWVLTLLLRRADHV